MSANSEQYSVICDDLNNSTLLGMDNYPKTPTSAYDVLCHYKNPSPKHQAHTPPGVATSVHYNNADSRKTVPGNDRRSFADVKCYLCQEMGHYSGT